MISERFTSVSAVIVRLCTAPGPNGVLLALIAGTGGVRNFGTSRFDMGLAKW